MVDVGATLVVAQTPMLQRMGRDAQNAKQMSGGMRAEVAHPKRPTTPSSPRKTRDTIPIPHGHRVENPQHQRRHHHRPMPRMRSRHPFPPP